jgi:hypothetical protein
MEEPWYNITDSSSGIQCSEYQKNPAVSEKREISEICGGQMKGERQYTGPCSVQFRSSERIIIVAMSILLLQLQSRMFLINFSSFPNRKIYKP